MADEADEWEALLPPLPAHRYRLEAGTSMRSASIG
jgi:hypothetical protein